MRLYYALLPQLASNASWFPLDSSAISPCVQCMCLHSSLAVWTAARLTESSEISWPLKWIRINTTRWMNEEALSTQDLKRLKMKFLNTLMVAAVVAGGYIADVQACITAKTALDGRSSPSSSAARTSNVYKSGACINGRRRECFYLLWARTNYESLPFSQVPNHWRDSLWK